MRHTIILILMSILVILSSCGGNSNSNQLDQELERKDSLMRINDSINNVLGLIELKLQERTDSIIQKKVLIEQEDNERINQEREEYEKWMSEVRKESDNRKNIERQKGPQWLDGVWSITTTSYNPFNGQSSIVKSSISINWDDQTLMCMLNNEMIENGFYTISDGAIHCGSSYWKIDEYNHRLEFGSGKYYTKYN